MTSVLDLNPIADIGTVVDPSGLADIGTVLSTSTIPDLGEILTSLMPCGAAGLPVRMCPRREGHVVGASRRGISAASSSRLVVPVLAIAR